MIATCGLPASGVALADTSHTTSGHNWRAAQRAVDLDEVVREIRGDGHDTSGVFEGPIQWAAQPEAAGMGKRCGYFI